MGSQWWRMSWEANGGGCPPLGKPMVEDVLHLGSQWSRRCPRMSSTWEANGLADVLHLGSQVSRGCPPLGEQMSRGGPPFGKPMVSRMSSTWEQKHVYHGCPPLGNKCLADVLHNTCLADVFHLGSQVSCVCVFVSCGYPKAHVSQLSYNQCLLGGVLSQYFVDGRCVSVSCICVLFCLLWLCFFGAMSMVSML